MAERQSPPFGPEQFFRTTQQFMAANPMMSMTSPPLRQVWVTNDKILDDFEELTHAWCERRHEANRTALEAARAISDTRGSDVSDAMKIMGDWLTKSMERLSEDAKDNYEFCVKCASHMAGGGVAASEELAETASEQAKRVASEAGRMTSAAEGAPERAKRAASTTTTRKTS